MCCLESYVALKCRVLCKEDRSTPDPTMGEPSERSSKTLHTEAAGIGSNRSYEAFLCKVEGISHLRMKSVIAGV